MKKIILILISFFMMNIASANTNVLQEIFGNSGNGDSCVSDYECDSLCCNLEAGTCKNHDEFNRCDKSPGQRCITSEFCKGEYVPVCKLVKLSNGSCTIRCQSTLVSGDCTNGICYAPRTPPIPPWDGVDCSNAVDP